ncbi:MAG: ASKHA domain-containing protein [Lachnospiraceae bacterium]|nr:ASKHA domain-containing protein [Lachnospiraceae bacterium]
MDRFQITVVRNGVERKIEGKAGESLLTALSEHDIYLSAACGGKGRCGKCGVQMVSGATEIREADRQFFHESQLEHGMRLACESYPQGDCRVVIETGDESDFEIVTEYAGEESGAGNGENGAAAHEGNGAIDKNDPVNDEGREITKESEYDIAVDIGTTTIAVSLIGRVGGKVCNTVTRINHQRAYGADVISRIQAANDGKLEELSCSIRMDLYESMGKLLSGAGVTFSQIRRVAIAGNTTMGHLLMGYPCETLGVYPFDPVNIETTQISFAELFSAAAAETADQEGVLHYAGEEIAVILLPGISTYVGADIAAGLLVCGFDHREEVNVLIDLGTNGEMAIGNREKILVTSTAAGPAFEGGNISCGMGSVSGAICQVEINGTDVSCETIGGKAPLGLCGTGVIESAYELLKEEWIDETGMLDEDYFDDGFPLAKTPDGEDISFSQKDVREIQLAKSAVRAGLETLLLRYGVTYDEVFHVYLAGGFGYRMNLEKAAGIGLLPEELLDRTEAAGNSSLGGAVEYLTGEVAETRMEKIIGISEEIPLASDKDFNRFYTDFMFFE